MPPLVVRAYAEGEQEMPERRRSRIVTLRSGACVSLRPVVAEDKPLLVDVFERLSERSLTRQRRTREPVKYR
jgi:hypothetical protein